MEWPSQSLDVTVTPYGDVIQDFRQNTFLSALASLGGLLPVIQGLDVICFGKPLFWGIFGMCQVVCYIEIDSGWNTTIRIEVLQGGSD
jgi:hypothetical protein